MKQKLEAGRRKVCLGVALAAASLFLAQNAAASCAASYCEDVRILTLYLAADDNVYVKVDGTPSTLGCTLYGGVYVTLSPTVSPTRFKEFYATLMAYQLADRPVSFGISSSLSACTITNIYMNSP